MNQRHQLCDEGFLCQWYIKMQQIYLCGNLQLVMRSKSRYKPSTTHVHISIIYFAPLHYLPCCLWNFSFLFWLELVKCFLPRTVLTFLTAKQIWNWPAHLLLQLSIWLHIFWTLPMNSRDICWQLMWTDNPNFINMSNSHTFTREFAPWWVHSISCRQNYSPHTIVAFIRSIWGFREYWGLHILKCEGSENRKMEVNFQSEDWWKWGWSERIGMLNGRNWNMILGGRTPSICFFLIYLTDHHNCVAVFRQMLAMLCLRVNT